MAHPVADALYPYLYPLTYEQVEEAIHSVYGPDEDSLTLSQIEYRLRRLVKHNGHTLQEWKEIYDVTLETGNKAWRRHLKKMEEWEEFQQSWQDYEYWNALVEANQAQVRIIHDLFEYIYRNGDTDAFNSELKGGSP